MLALTFAAFPFHTLARLVSASESLDIGEDPPEHFPFAGIDALEWIPWTSSAFHFDDDDFAAVRRANDEIGLVLAVARAAPVSREDGVAQRAKETLGSALAWISSRREGRRERVPRQSRKERPRHHPAQPRQQRANAIVLKMARKR